MALLLQQTSTILGIFCNYNIIYAKFFTALTAICSTLLAPPMLLIYKGLHHAIQRR